MQRPDAEEGEARSRSPALRASANTKPQQLQQQQALGRDGKLRIVQVTDLHIMDIDRAFEGTDVPAAKNVNPIT